MFSRLILLYVFLIKTILSDESENATFVVVSTTNRPSPTDNNDDLVNRLRLLESQAVQFQKLFDSYNTILTQIQTQISQIQKKFESRSNLYSNKDSDHSLPQNCKEVQERGQNVSDIYYIQPKLAPEPILVRCNMESRGGGWTYILNRFDGTQDFDQTWENYKHGFGTMDSEFWLGLENMHSLTGSELNELLIELVDWDMKEVYALYSSFSIGSEQEGYSLKLLSRYSGNAGDSLSYHRGMKFSTKDNDQDLWSKNCAAYTPSGWWYRTCEQSRLTGKYLGKTVNSADYYNGVYWLTFHGYTYSVKEARMMVRPVG